MQHRRPKKVQKWKKDKTSQIKSKTEKKSLEAQKVSKTEKRNNLN
jgi:hypothetical protein